MSPDSKLVVARGAVHAAYEKLAQAGDRATWMDKARDIRDAVDVLDHATDMLREAEKELSR